MNAKVHLQIDADIDEIWDSFTEYQQKQLVLDYIGGMSATDIADLVNRYIDYADFEVAIKFLEKQGYKVIGI